MLSAEQINQNYQQALTLCQSLLKVKFGNSDYQATSQAELFLEMAQSALAEEPVVQLLMTQPFRANDYKPVLQNALETVKKQLALELNNRRMVALEKVQHFLIDTEEVFNDSAALLQKSQNLKSVFELLENRLSPSTLNFLKHLQIVGGDDEQNTLHRFLSSFVPLQFSGHEIEHIEEKLKLLQRLYPDGQIKIVTIEDGRQALSEEEIVLCYKNILAGLERFYPPNFLKHDALKRSRLIIRFLIKDFLQMDAQDLLQNSDSTFFIRYKIQNIYRYFNYSVNRLLQNAFPEQIAPWMSSRIPENYWEKGENRLQAIRWLVEEKLQLNPEILKKSSISKKDFAQNGLSYLFANYYNAVSRALQAAYPHLEPWEVGQVPKSYWTNENSARAVKRMIQKLGWSIDSLPERFKKGELSRKTFSQMGLSTMFELRYGKNIYKAINAAFPGRFEPWQFGNIPAEFWRSWQNVFYASQWIARQEGVPQNEITKAVRSKQLSLETISKYSIGSRLKKLAGNSLIRLFQPFFIKEWTAIHRELTIQKKIRSLVRKELSRPLLTFLCYGFYAHIVRLFSKEFIDRIKRIEQRRRRYQYLN